MVAGVRGREAEPRMKPCPCHPSHCNPLAHSPGGETKGTWPFRPGKTRRDKESGAWGRRFANRARRDSA